MLELNIHRAAIYHYSYQRELRSEINKLEKRVKDLSVIKELGKNFIDVNIHFRGDLYNYALDVFVHLTSDTPREVAERLKRILNEEILYGNTQVII